MEYENEAPKSRTQRAKEHVGRNKGKYIAGTAAAATAGGAYAARNTTAGLATRSGIKTAANKVADTMWRGGTKRKYATGTGAGLVAVGGVAGYYAHRKKKRAAAAAAYE